MNAVFIYLGNLVVVILRFQVFNNYRLNPGSKFLVVGIIIYLLDESKKFRQLLFILSHPSSIFKSKSVSTNSASTSSVVFPVFIDGSDNPE